MTVTNTDKYVTDPTSGMQFLRMAYWLDVSFTPSLEAIADAEAREGITYTEATGLTPPAPVPAAMNMPALAAQLTDLQSAVDQLILDNLMNSLGGF